MLPDFLHNVHCQALVTLRIDLGHVGLGMAQNDLCGLQAELLPHFGSAGVPEAVRCPIGQQRGVVDLEFLGLLPDGLVRLIDAAADRTGVAVLGVAVLGAAAWAGPCGGSAGMASTWISAAALISTCRFVFRFGRAEAVGGGIAEQIGQDDRLGLGADVDDPLSPVVLGLV